MVKPQSQHRNTFLIKKIDAKSKIESFILYLRPQFGAIAQLVEQRTENPCVPGSNPGSTTLKTPHLEAFFFEC